MSIKNISFFAQTTNTSGETINENSQSSFSQARSEFARMNVIINVTALAGTSPTIAFSVLESFGGVFVETAKSSALSTTGQYVLCQHAVPDTNVSKNDGPFPALGSGMNKRVTTTIGGTTSAVTADIYFGFFN